MAQYYEWFKVLHLIAVISWMVGLLYLPRLFAYHTSVKVGSEADEIFKIMELKLLRYIMNPAMIATFLFGIILSSLYGMQAMGLWFHIKVLCVLFLTLFHSLLAKWRKNFFMGKNIHTKKFFKFMNEAPTMLMIIIVIMVIVKPFD